MHLRFTLYKGSGKHFQGLNEQFKELARCHAQSDTTFPAAFGTLCTDVISGNFCLSLPGTGTVGWSCSIKPKRDMALLSYIL
jgi:hypothetical protein